MWELDHKKGWAPKNRCFQTVVLEKTHESSLDCKVIKPVNPKGNQPWIFTGRTDTLAPKLWPPDAKSRLTGKNPWCWERLKAKGEEEQRMWWFDSITGQWTWICTNSMKSWRTGKPSMLCHGVTELDMLSDGSTTWQYKVSFTQYMSNIYCHSALNIIVTSEPRLMKLHLYLFIFSTSAFFLFFKWIYLF